MLIDAGADLKYQKNINVICKHNTKLIIQLCESGRINYKEFIILRGVITDDEVFEYCMNILYTKKLMMTYLKKY